uniref:Uncharacterized protein n=1 Tax=Strigamia maritima TaxID=126957 RepID=T1IUM1_STRMM
MTINKTNCNKNDHYKDGKNYSNSCAKQYKKIDYLNNTNKINHFHLTTMILPALMRFVSIWSLIYFSCKLQNAIVTGRKANVPAFGNDNSHAKCPPGHYILIYHVHQHYFDQTLTEADMSNLETEIEEQAEEEQIKADDLKNQHYEFPYKCIPIGTKPQLIPDFGDAPITAKPTPIPLNREMLIQYNNMAVQPQNLKMLGVLAVFRIHTAVVITYAVIIMGGFVVQKELYRKQIKHLQMTLQDDNQESPKESEISGNIKKIIELQAQTKDQRSADYDEKVLQLQDQLKVLLAEKKFKIFHHNHHHYRCPPNFHEETENGKPQAYLHLQVGNEIKPDFQQSENTDGSNKPEDGSNKPEDGSNKPKDGSNKPENGSNKPEDGSNKPEDGSNKPKDESNKPENGSNKPEDGSKKQGDGSKKQGDR